VWSGGGEAALARHAPEVAGVYAELAGARSAGVDVALLAEPAVVAFSDQFRVDVAGISEDQRAAFAATTGAQLFPVTQMVWLGDVLPRLRSALDALFGESDWKTRPTLEVPDTWPLVEGFMQAVARLDTLDAVLTELVRLRGARQHDCRICRSRRSADAIEQGADDAMFAAVDAHATSDLPAQSRAALALVDAIIWTPHGIPAEVVEAVRAQLTPAQAVEVVLDVIRNAANKIAVALRADAAEVADGVQLFTTASDGTLTTLA
jgi:alkylhydroperoxidase family enzyme